MPEGGEDNSGLRWALLRRTSADVAWRWRGQIAFPITPGVGAAIAPNRTPCTGKPINQAPSDSTKVLPTIRTLAFGRDRLWLAFGNVKQCHEITLRPRASARYHHIRESTRGGCPRSALLRTTISRPGNPALRGRIGQEARTCFSGTRSARACRHVPTDGRIFAPDLSGSTDKHLSNAS